MVLTLLVGSLSIFRFFPILIFMPDTDTLNPIHVAKKVQQWQQQIEVK